DDLIERRIESGMRALEEQRARFANLEMAGPMSPILVSYLAQWVDIGFHGPELVRGLLERYPAGTRANLELREYVHLRLAEGILAMRQKQPEEAIGHFDLVLLLCEELGDRELLAITNFWVARGHRQKGEYDRALSYTVRARGVAAELGFTRLAAVTQVLE